MERVVIVDGVIRKGRKLFVLYKIKNDDNAIIFQDYEGEEVDTLLEKMGVESESQLVGKECKILLNGGLNIEPFNH